MGNTDTVKIKGFRMEFEMDKDLVSYIDNIFLSNLTEKTPIVKTGDIYTDINSGYYTQKKYHPIEKKEKLLGDIEEYVNDNVRPRDYQKTLDLSLKYVKILEGKYLYIGMVSVDWITDWFELNNVTDENLKRQLSSFIYDWGVDEYNKPSQLDDLLTIYNYNR